MWRFMTTGPPPDNRTLLDYVDDKMTDDGCPLTPGPVRPCDEDWRNNFEEYDTFGDEPAGPSSSVDALGDRRGR
jgi:hypothetical protein